MGAERAERPPHLWVVGPGRAGLALGLAAFRAGAAASITVSGRSPTPPDHPLFHGDPPAARYLPDLALPDPAPGLLVVAVPDAAIAEVARALAARPIPEGLVALHTSGALGAEVLAPLRERGAAAGSLHPLVAIADPVAGAERLRGAWYAVEGDETARVAAGRLVAALGGRVLAVAPEAKPLYHAAAVFASNYLVAILAVAERLAAEAGAPREDARAALVELSRGALEGVAERGPAEALTGPVSRGDAETVALHLARLSPPDAALYSVLARATLEVARARGLDPGAAARIEQLLPEAE